MNIFLLIVNQYDNTIIKYLNNTYFIFQFLIIFSISSTFVRLYFCLKINKKKDDLINYENFEYKKYFFQKFYIIIIIIIACILIIIIAIYEKNKKFNLFFPISKIINDENNEYSNYRIFWEIIFMIENVSLFTISLFLINNELNRELYLLFEIFSICIVNFIHSNICIIGISYKKIKKIIFYEEIFYFLFLHIFSIIFPLLLSSIKKNLIYEITSNSTKDFYLFMSNKQCYSYFYKYLSLKNDFIKIRYFLSLYFSIMNFKLFYLIDSNKEPAKKEAIKIIENFFNINQDNNYIDSNTCYKIRNDIINQNRNDNLNIEVFDNVLKICTAHLYEKYKQFLKTEEYSNLLCEINYKIYLRCKLSKYGLIKI
jgi:hypothetical protein